AVRLARALKGSLRCLSIRIACSMQREPFEPIPADPEVSQHKDWLETYHPMIPLMLLSPRLKIFRCDAGYVDLNLLSLCCPLLTTLHVLEPAKLTGTLSGFHHLESISFGNGSWGAANNGGSLANNARFAGWGGTGRGMMGEGVWAAEEADVEKAARTTGSVVVEMTEEARMRLKRLALAGVKTEPFMKFLGIVIADAEGQPHFLDDDEEDDLDDLDESEDGLEIESMPPPLINASASADTPDLMDSNLNSADWNTAMDVAIHPAVAAHPARPENPPPPMSPLPSQPDDTSNLRTATPIPTIRRPNLVIFANLNHLWARCHPALNLDQLRRLLFRCPHLSTLDVSFAPPLEIEPDHRHPGSGGLSQFTVAMVELIMDLQVEGAVRDRSEDDESREAALGGAADDDEEEYEDGEIGEEDDDEEDDAVMRIRRGIGARSMTSEHEAAQDEADAVLTDVGRRRRRRRRRRRELRRMARVTPDGRIVYPPSAMSRLKMLGRERTEGRRLSMNLWMTQVAIQVAVSHGWVRSVEEFAAQGDSRVVVKFRQDFEVPGREL
ncbi:hypothetical protein HK101_006981, partial [Irineochytrium annulatum]